jgi:translation initiation factor eIF-2B subunit delta
MRPERKAVQWERFVGPIRTDRTSGAAELARRAAKAMLDWADQAAPVPYPRWKTELTAFASALYAAQPAMAPLLNLANSVLLALESAGAPEEARPRVRETARAFLEHSEQVHNRVARAALQFLPQGARVLTFSYSSSVLAVLLQAHAQQRLCAVFCTESRPMCEGQRLARALTEAGVAVEFGVDAAISVFAPRSSVALVGADSLTVRGAVNKLGTTGLALVSRHVGIPCYVIGDRQKWVPAAAKPPALARLNPGEEVWPTPPLGVTVWNAYFECTPLELFSGIIGENGLLTAGALLRELSNLPVAQGLCSGVKPPS